MKTENGMAVENLAATAIPAVEESFEPAIELETESLEATQAEHESVTNATTEMSNSIMEGTEGSLTLVSETMIDTLENVPNADLSVLNEMPLMDAAVAEFGTSPATEVVIGRDDRIRINGTRNYPWRCICSLLITAQDGSRWIGTGFLVGPRTVITAGHVVYMHSRGGWAKSIEVIPGRNAASRPFGSCTTSRFHSVKGWTQSRNRNYDYGAIILPANCKFGNRLGYFGFGNYSDTSLRNLTVNLSGYPGDKPAGTQWWHARRIVNLNSRVLTYNIDTFGGQSGSPVWFYRNGKRYVVGIHTNGSRVGNSATRLSKPVYDNLVRWKNAYR